MRLLVCRRLASSYGKGILMSDKTNNNSSAWPFGELGRRLMSKGLITRENLDRAISLSEETGAPLVEEIVLLKLSPKSTVYDELAAIYGVPFIDLDTYISDPMVMSFVDEKTARELEAFPLFVIGASLAVAFVRPDDILAMDRVAAVSKCTVEPYLAAKESMAEAINRSYGSGGEIKDFISKMTEDSVPMTQTAEAQQRTVQSNESPVSRLVDLIVTNAVRDRASDIHVGLDEEQIRVRFRIDGVLYEVPPPPNYLFPFVISRIKVMSNLDIAESRVPQDGHFKAIIDGRTVEARISCIPTIYGESIAIRILNTTDADISLENLGVPESLMGSVDEMVHHTHGMVVITGPTGSGKSTTLYAMLSKAKSSERHIITVEDPVERRIKMVSQIQINERAGLNFASALRSILRHDPDVIMVGEIRDQETARLSVRAALTGHLVFSTIHTNDAPGAVTRLINMGIEPFLLSSALVGAVAQRLARCICAECKQPYDIPSGIRQRLESAGVPAPKAVWRGAGCSHCRNTGYSRRTGVFELMPVSSQLAEMIALNVPANQLRVQARKEGMSSILEDGLSKVTLGITTLEEVLRIAELEDVSEVQKAVPHAVETEIAIAEPEEKAASSPKIGLDLEEYRKKMATWLAVKSG
jgi:type IV pilus assembly protein PilB